jgi:high-affinity K+ transport system ATPase subunit B
MQAMMQNPTTAVSYAYVYALLILIASLPIAVNGVRWRVSAVTTAVTRKCSGTVVGVRQSTKLPLTSGRC